MIKDQYDVWDYINSIQHQAYWESWLEFKKARRNKKSQTWETMESLKFVKLVRNAFNGTLSKEDLDVIENYQDRIIYNYHKLEFNTIIVGHTSYSPSGFVQDYDLVAEDASKKSIERAVNACCDWIAYNAFSDYGLKPIAELIYHMVFNQVPSLKVQIMAEIIGVTHCRGDLSLFFIQDGKTTYQKIDQYEPEYELNWNRIGYREREQCA